MSYLGLDHREHLQFDAEWLQNFAPQIKLAVSFGNWMLILMNFMPMSMIVTLDLVRYIQAKFVEWDVSMVSLSKCVEAKVANTKLTEDLG